MREDQPLSLSIQGNWFTQQLLEFVAAAGHATVTKTLVRVLTGSGYLNFRATDINSARPPMLRNGSRSAVRVVQA
jgi:hypothetical protein